MATITNLPGTDQSLPANIVVEKVVFGAILLNDAAHSEASEKIDADYFSLDSHRRTYSLLTYTYR